MDHPPPLPRPGEGSAGAEWNCLRPLLGEGRISPMAAVYCRVILIRFHESPEAPFKTSMPTAIKTFQDYLNRNGVVCTLRASRGQDIDAACGLLAGKE